MRYLITVPSLTPGSGLSRYVFTLCKILSEADNSVWVLTTHNGESTDYERNELELISKKIQLVSIGNKSKLSRYICAIRVIRKIKPDIIVNNYNALIQYILPLIGNKMRVIHILHGDTDDFYRIGSINATYVNGWIVPTAAIADNFNKYTRNKYCKRVTILSHGVAECDLTEKKSSVLEIVYAGVLYEHKGVKILPDIIKKLREKSVDLHFTIIGGGVLEDWLKREFKAEISSGIVTMTGVVSHVEVYNIMANADLFLYPTHLDSFGLVIAEAMMNGAVPIVTLLPGITDNLIVDGENGFLLPQDDVEEFANRILQLSVDVELRKRMSEAAHHRAVTEFSQAKMSSNYTQYFHFL